MTPMYVLDIHVCQYFEIFLYFKMSYVNNFDGFLNVDRPFKMVKRRRPNFRLRSRPSTPVYRKKRLR